MVSADCGYHDSPHGAKLLAYYGPVLLVNVGFDPTYKADKNRPPVSGLNGIEALVDTGAQEGCIDSSLAAQLRLPIVDRRPVCGVHGAIDVDMHLAQVHIPSLKFTLHGRFAGVHLVAGGHPQKVLIGRSFLKHFRLAYDGTNGYASITAP
jgi:hypothetical protein